MASYITFNEQHLDWLNKLSVEIIERVILQLSAIDIVNLGKCCHRLHEITTNEMIWKELIWRHYGLDIKKTDNSKGKSARLFYLRILARFGSLLSSTFQRNNFTYYGGIVKVVYHDFALYVLELDPPPFPNVLKGLQPQVICRISLDKYDEKGVVRIEQETTDYGEIQSIEVIKAATDDKIITFSIISKVSTLPFVVDLRGEIAAWFEADIGPGPSEGIVRVQEFAKRFGLMQNMAFEKLSDRIDFLNQGVQLCTALPSLKDTPLSHFWPMTPGVFKGTYGPHGIEIIKVGYESNPSTEYRCEAFIVGEKLYGDRNVPCNQLTFKAFLNKPMTLTSEGQSTIKKIEEHMISSKKSVLPSRDTKPITQPFILPDECDCEFPLDDNEVFSNALWRFEATCQIAEDKYKSPQWIKGNLVVFSDDLFGVIFMAEAHGFNSMTIYHRVQEKLSAICYEDLFEDLPLGKLTKNLLLKDFLD